MPIPGSVNTNIPWRMINYKIIAYKLKERGKMSERNIKKECAKEALKYIKNNTTIGLGGGSTIGYLIDYIQADKDLNVKIVTPSYTTKLLCLQRGFDVLHTFSVDQIDVAFDGCDQVDENLHALKSGGGIHTKEKLISNMANDYILLVDETKFVDRLTFKHPVVLEVLEDALAYVKNEIENLGGKAVARESSAKDGFTVSDNGNLLIDTFFENVKDSCDLEKKLSEISGVIDTSLFTNTVTKVLVASDSGIKLISKN